MSFSPVYRWVGWRHYIQYRPSRHHRSQPHISPLASGTLARTRWCTGFIQGGGQNREQNSWTRWKIQRKVEQVNINTSGSTNGCTSMLKNLQNWLHLRPNFSFVDAKQVFFFLRQTSNAPGRFASSTSHFFPSFLPSGGTKPGTPFCLAASDETRSNSVWRRLQLPFGCASLNHFKYTLTCAHPLTGRQGTEEGGATKIVGIFFPPCRLTNET